MSVPPWTVVITKPAAEFVAERNLRQAGYRVYLPVYRRVMFPHGNARNGKPSMRPLFQGYSFVHDWRGWPFNVAVNGTLGIMRSCGRNVTMSDEDIEILRLKERAGEFDLAQSPHSTRVDLEVGCDVEKDIGGEIIAGVLDELTPSGKAVIQALMFGRTVRMTVDAHDLRAAASAAT